MKWTPEQTAILIEKYATAQASELEALTGKCRKVIRQKAGRLGIRKTRETIAKANRGRGQTPRKRRAMLALVRLLLNRHEWATYAEIQAACGIEHKPLKSLIERARDAGEVFAAGKHAHNRYFATLEGAQAAAPLLAKMDADRDAARKARNTDRQKVRYRATYVPVPKEARKKVGRPKALKPPKPPKAPNPILLAKSAKKPPVNRWADLPVVVPAHVRVQVLPGYTGAPAWEMRGRTW